MPTNPKRKGSQRMARASSGSSGLGQREYRDAQGQIHHHTKKYMEQHAQPSQSLSSRRGSGSSGSRGGSR
ncbi:MAG TPA: hypothetical protein VKY73_04935 [Polyangiaceae bacterium]|nr:hypothetical protein [Polyangiaceae bacterium]